MSSTAPNPDSAEQKKEKKRKRTALQGAHAMGRFVYHLGKKFVVLKRRLRFDDTVEYYIVNADDDSDKFWTQDISVDPPIIVAEPAPVPAIVWEVRVDEIAQLPAIPIPSALFDSHPSNDLDEALLADIAERLNTSQSSEDFFDRESEAIAYGHLSGEIWEEFKKNTSLCQICRRCGFIHLDEEEYLHFVCQISFDMEDPNAANKKQKVIDLTSDEVLPPRPSNPPKEMMCVVCGDRPKSILLSGCSHVSLCNYCVEQLNTNNCPICRAEFESHRSVFI